MDGDRQPQFFYRLARCFDRQHPAPNLAPAAEKIVAWQMPENSPTSPLCRTMQQAAFRVSWYYLNQRQSWPAFSG